MNNFLPYTIKIWLFTAIAGPLFTFTHFFTNNYTLHSNLTIFFKLIFTMLFAFGCSIPFIAAHAGVNKYLFRMQQDIKITKALITVVGLLLGFLPLLLIQKHMNHFYLKPFTYMWIYACVMTIAIWSFRIQQEVVLEKPTFRSDILDDDLGL